MLYSNKTKRVDFTYYLFTLHHSLTKELIKTQLDEMLVQGIRTVYILPEPKEFRPDSMVTYMTPEYLSDEFFMLVRYAVEYAASLHISTWLYDEGGWPSGNACGMIVKKHPDTKPKSICEKVLSLNEGDIIYAGEYISVFTNNYKKLKLPYVADKPCEVYAYYIKQHEENIFTHIIDERVINEFIESTYEGYKKYLGDLFSNKVTAIFTDEPLIEYPYYVGDVTDFEKQYGYSFEDNVYALFSDEVNEENRRFKIDYIEYCSKVFDERFVEPISNWCKNNNILFTGHYDGDNTLGGIGFKKQVGNVLPHLRYMDIPGIDVILRQIFPGNTDNTFFPRFASSAAHQTGKNLSVSESFAVYGNGLTFEQMRYVCNYQFVRGINIINFMSVTSGRSKCLSSQCRPHYIPQLPEFDFRKSYNDYISRMMYVCQFGEVQCDTALYIPMRDIWAGENAESVFWNMGKSLEEKQIYFDIIDDDFIINGNLEYKNIYVPKTKYISPEAKAVLEKCGAEIHYSVECAQGPVKCNNKHIRVMKRVFGNESLYVIFNEHVDDVNAEIDFFENKHGYILDCYDGSIKALSDKLFRLCSGEALVVLFTDKYPEAETDKKFKPYALINEFDVKPICKAEFVNQQLCMKTQDITIDESFSGSACYSARFEYDGEGDIVIELEDVYYYAEIKVNGHKVKNLIMPPYNAVIESNYLKKDNLLEITVANTSANAYVYADYSNVPLNAIGPYHERTLNFEKESLKFGLKTVKLFKINERK